MSAPGDSVDELAGVAVTWGIVREKRLVRSSAFRARLPAVMDVNHVEHERSSAGNQL